MGILLIHTRHYLLLLKYDDIYSTLLSNFIPLVFILCYTCLSSHDEDDDDEDVLLMRRKRLTRTAVSQVSLAKVVSLSLSLSLSLSS